MEAYSFYDHHKMAGSFFYEFLHEVGQNNCTNTHCLRGDTHIAPLYCIRRLS